MKAAEAIISGIKCDSSDCDYTDENVSMDDYDAWLNKPCPKCGANLLTEADLAAVRGMIAAAKWMNEIAPPDADGPILRVRMDLDGTGRPKFGKVTVEKGRATDG